MSKGLDAVKLARKKRSSTQETVRPLEEQDLKVDDEIKDDGQHGLSRKRKREASRPRLLEIDLSAPEPPSKKAVRKSRKPETTRLTVVEPPTTKTTDSSDRPDGLESAHAAKRADWGVWIGNLSYSITKPDLRKFLVDRGSIADEEITRIYLPSLGAAAGSKPAAPNAPIKKTPNRGFAYIDFDTSAALDRALALNETLVTGRKVLIKNAKSFEGRPKTTNRDRRDSSTFGDLPPNRRVFVGNLSFDTTKEDLVDRLGRCGELDHVHLATFEDTGKCKGYAWVDFVELEAAKTAVRGWTSTSNDRDPERDEARQEKPERANEADDDEEPSPERAQRAEKPPRHWINRINGRTLKIEFAEDRATRYRKRFGKVGIQPDKGQARVTTSDRPTRASHEHRAGDGHDSRPRRRGRDGKEKASSSGSRETAIRDNARPTRRPGHDTRSAQGYPQPLGKKINFD